MKKRLLKILYANEFLYSFACWYRQISIDLNLSFHSSPKILRILMEAVAFIPKIIIGVVYSILGQRMVSGINQHDKTRKFEHEIAFVAIVKNEGSYLAEWLEYHNLIGVTKFLIYDNGSTDNTVAVLKQYMDCGLVEYIHYPGERKQVLAYSDAIERLKEKARYVAFIDLDEFVVVTKPEVSFLDVVNGIMEKNPTCGGVAISWLMFGSNGHKKKPDGLVIDNYTRRAVDSYMTNIKTIGNPRVMKMFATPHYPVYLWGTSNVNERGKKVRSSLDFHKSVDTVRINHYFTKSEEECMAKIKKGIATVGEKRNEGIFKERDRNDLTDTFITKYSGQIKCRLEDRKK